MEGPGTGVEEVEGVESLEVKPCRKLAYFRAPPAVVFRP